MIIPAVDQLGPAVSMTVVVDATASVAERIARARQHVDALIKALWLEAPCHRAITLAGEAFHALTEAGSAAERGVTLDGTPTAYPEFVTPDLPEGFDTILGFLAANRCPLLDVFDCPALDVQMDHVVLARITREGGQEPAAVMASEGMRREGFHADVAYPVAQLARFYLGTDAVVPD